MRMAGPSCSALNKACWQRQIFQSPLAVCSSEIVIMCLSPVNDPSACPCPLTCTPAVVRTCDFARPVRFLQSSDPWNHYEDVYRPNSAFAQPSYRRKPPDPKRSQPSEEMCHGTAGRYVGEGPQEPYGNTREEPKKGDPRSRWTVDKEQRNASKRAFDFGWKAQNNKTALRRFCCFASFTFG